MRMKWGGYHFFTDIPLGEVLEKFPYIKEEKILETRDIYGYLGEGIVITSVQNTDYTRGSIVHVYKEDGLRHRFSRVPILYYSLSQEKQEFEFLMSKLQNLELVF
jgi:hypothetical protein